MVKINRENRRFGRLIMDKGLRVSMNSIGSEVRYNMETKNISDTGFFLDFEKPGRFPFTPASIMEVWLELEEDNAIFFNGKMTRVVYPDEAASLDIKPGIAIKIVQIEASAENALREFIRKAVMENEAKDTETTTISAAQANEQETHAEQAKKPTRKKTTRSTATKTAKKSKTSTRKTTTRKTRSKKVVTISEKKETNQILSPPKPEENAG